MSELINKLLRSEVERLRRDFPILNQTINDAALVYLDNAATTHKPLTVMNAVQQFYSADNSNIHRGVHTLSERATEAYETARSQVQRFINASESDEIIFVRGVTEAVNLVAAGFGRKVVHSGDEIVITEMEHHSNIVPWQMLCEERGAMLKVVPIDDEGDLRLDEYAALLTERTRLVAITHASNVLGTVNPLREIIEMAHRQNIPVFVDGAQSAPHLKVDVQELDCDFYAFSGHKIYGPTGIGVLYGKAERLAQMLPYQTGGGAINSVTFRRPVLNRRLRSSRRERLISQARLDCGPLSNTSTRLALSGLLRTKMNCSTIRSQSFPRFQACASLASRAKESASCRLSSQACTRTT